MKVLSPAVTLWCDEPGNEGITSSILLTTSNSVVHIWNFEDDTGLLEFDLYSCAPFTPEEVIAYIGETLGDERSLISSLTENMTSQRSPYPSYRCEYFSVVKNPTGTGGYVVALQKPRNEFLFTVLTLIKL
jgi:hypothetical protein